MAARQKSAIPWILVSRRHWFLLNPIFTCVINGTHLRRNSKNRNTSQEEDQEHHWQLQTDTDQTDTDEARQLVMDLSTHTLPK